jgi:hypothetical protein
MIRTIDPQTPQSAVVFGRPIATLIATLIAVCVRRNHVAAIPPTWQPYRTCGRHTAHVAAIPHVAGIPHVAAG